MRTIIMIMFAAVTSISIAQKPGRYDACCGAEPVEYIHKDMEVYLPNVFTPNRDNVNDLFYPLISGKVVEVIDFVIYTGTGEDTMIYYRPTIVYSNIQNEGWNGMRFNTDIPYIGSFKYSFKIVNAKGETNLFIGRACRLDCDPEAEKLKQKQGCYFPDQQGAAGKLDKLKKTKEKKCE